MYSEVMKSFTAQASFRGASNHGFRKGGKEAKVQPIDVREGPKMAPRCLGFLALQLKYVHNFLVLSVSPRYATLTSLLRDLICRVLVKSRGITEAGSGVSQFCKTYRSTKAIRCEWRAHALIEGQPDKKSARATWWGVGMKLKHRGILLRHRICITDLITWSRKRRRRSCRFNPVLKLFFRLWIIATRINCIRELSSYAQRWSIRTLGHLRSNAVAEKFWHCLTLISRIMQTDFSISENNVRLICAVFFFFVHLSRWQLT